MKRPSQKVGSTILPLLAIALLCCDPRTASAELEANEPTGKSVAIEASETSISELLNPADQADWIQCKAEYQQLRRQAKKFRDDAESLEEKTITWRSKLFATALENRDRLKELSAAPGAYKPIRISANRFAAASFGPIYFGSYRPEDQTKAATLLIADLRESISLASTITGAEFSFGGGLGLSDLKAQYQLTMHALGYLAKFDEIIGLTKEYWAALDQIGNAKFFRQPRMTSVAAWPGREEREVRQGPNELFASAVLPHKGADEGCGRVAMVLGIHCDLLESIADIKARREFANGTADALFAGKTAVAYIEEDAAKDPRKQSAMLRRELARLAGHVSSLKSVATQGVVTPQAKEEKLVDYADSLSLLVEARKPTTPAVSAPTQAATAQ
jgi:hypothetical protein